MILLVGACIRLCADDKELAREQGILRYENNKHYRSTKEGTNRDGRDAAIEDTAAEIAGARLMRGEWTGWFEKIPVAKPDVRLADETTVDVKNISRRWAPLAQSLDGTSRCDLYVPIYAWQWGVAYTNAESWRAEFEWRGYATAAELKRDENRKPGKRWGEVFTLLQPLPHQFFELPQPVLTTTPTTTCS